MSNALREAVLHGPDLYNRLRPRCLAEAERLGLSSNANFQAPPFAVRWDEVKSKTFTAWATPAQFQGEGYDRNVVSHDRSGVECDAHGGRSCRRSIHPG